MGWGGGSCSSRKKTVQYQQALRNSPRFSLALSWSQLKEVLSCSSKCCEPWDYLFNLPCQKLVKSFLPYTKLVIDSTVIGWSSIMSSFLRKTHCCHLVCVWTLKSYILNGNPSTLQYCLITTWTLAYH